MKHIIFLLVVFSLSTATFAQNYQKQYLNAKSLYNDGDYALAMEAFRPIIRRSSDNPFAAYASYYYGLSNYYAGFPEQARTIMLQAKERFPNWTRVDEINYWIAKLYFENSDHYLALNTLGAIKDPSVKEDAEAMTMHYLGEDTDAVEMAAIYEKYPSEATGTVYAKKLTQEPLDARGRKTLEELIGTYDLDPEIFETSVQSTELKDTYRVAVMMPFLVNTIKAGDKNRVNEFVLDLYNGIEMAVDSLKKTGVNIELYAYDTERDTTATRRLLQQDELKGMDMIIGPLFSGPAKMVSEFGLQYGINVFNPLSNSPDNLDGNPHYFLLQPSAVTIGEVMADYAAENYADRPGVVLFGESDNDVKMARAYVKRYEAQTGQKLISMGISNEDSEEILQLLLSTTNIKDATTEEGRENISIGMDSLSHIFVASNNSLIFSKVVSAVETRGDNIQIIGSQSWVEMPIVKYETFERLKVIFYAPGYIDQRSPVYRRYQRDYIRKHRKVPSSFSDQGFEIAMFLGSSLNKYGNYPQLGWDEENIISGTITPGYSYPNKQDNQVVPILNFREDKLDILIRKNKPLKDQCSTIVAGNCLRLPRIIYQEALIHQYAHLKPWAVTHYL